jgi:hypothetical protein
MVRCERKQVHTRLSMFWNASCDVVRNMTTPAMVLTQLASTIYPIHVLCTRRFWGVPPGTVPVDPRTGEAWLEPRLFCRRARCRRRPPPRVGDEAPPPPVATSSFASFRIPDVTSCCPRNPAAILVDARIYVNMLWARARGCVQGVS